MGHEMWAFSLIISAIACDGIQQRIVPEAWKQQEGEPIYVLLKIAHEFHETEEFVGTAENCLAQRHVGVMKANQDHNEPGGQQDSELLFGDRMHLAEIEVGFPSLKDVFDPPA